MLVNLERNFYMTLMVIDDITFTNIIKKKYQNILYLREYIFKWKGNFNSQL
jgi:hypothetical protein